LNSKLKNSISSILFWSVISAAFIGPGTVTTAASSGSAYGISLTWVLVISTIACIVLQINVTKLTIHTGKTIGELLLKYFNNYKFIPITLGISIVFGCAAYQAGNLLGATLGISLLFHVEQKWILLSIVLMASSMLWLGTIQFVVKLLGSIVAIMGITFIFIAFSISVPVHNLLESSFIPSFPFGSELLIMGLIGTTIVPYNLFLGSGLSIGKNLSSSRIGLIFAISLGGMISIAILISGTLVSAPFDFEKLSSSLTENLGLWANYLLGIGLFSAGFTSSITAPLAAIFTIKSVFPGHKNLANRKSSIYKSIWGIVMITGFTFGFVDISPIPVIILAQAANGIILPFISVFILVLVVFSIKKTFINAPSILLIGVVYLIVVIGIYNFLKLFHAPGVGIIFISFGIALVVIAGVLAFTFYMRIKEKI
jgi:Mn2+/Fe2+ NRAMP family transporter